MRCGAMFLQRRGKFYRQLAGYGDTSAVSGTQPVSRPIPVAFAVPVPFAILFHICRPNG